TADLALEEGREVFAVPGEITSSLSAGTNALLKLGATPLTSAADVLASFGIEPEPVRGESSPLLDLLPASADELVRKTGLGPAEISQTLDALDRMADLAGDALRRTGSYRLAGDEEEREGIRLEYEALREDGFEAEWLDDVPGGAAGRFHGAISHPHDGSIQPARFVRRLAALATAAGAEFREHHQVGDLAALDADRVLVATDGYGHGLVPELADLVWPTRGQMIASEPLDRV